MSWSSALEDSLKLVRNYPAEAWFLLLWEVITAGPWLLQQLPRVLDTGSASAILATGRCLYHILIVSDALMIKSGIFAIYIV